jgi:hypothetical protein
LYLRLPSSSSSSSSSWPIRIFSDAPRDDDAVFLTGRGAIRGVAGLSDIGDIDAFGVAVGGGAVEGG